MKKWITAIYAIGFLLLVVGVAYTWEPAVAAIVGGALLLAFGLALDRANS